jgi:hypothetical protein
MASRSIHHRAVPIGNASLVELPVKDLDARSPSFDARPIAGVVLSEHGNARTIV